MKARTVDLAAVRAARAKLRRIASEHPELVGPSTEKNRAGWITTLEDIEMAEHGEQIVVRLPADLVERIDAHVERMKGEQPGMRITRSDAVRMLIIRALEDATPKRGTRKPKGAE